MFLKQTKNKQKNIQKDAQPSVNRRHKPDYSLLILSLLLSVIGLIVVYSISPALAATHNVDNSYFVTKQLLAIGIGLFAFIVFSYISLNFLKDMRMGLVGVGLLSIVALMIFGEEVNGATRWIQLGGLSFQVAEFLKFMLIVWLGAFLVEQARRNALNSLKTKKYILLALVLIGVVVAILTSDLGSAAVLGAILIIMAFQAGISTRSILVLGGVVVIGGLLAIGTGYRQERVETFLNPEANCQDEGYQSCQALIAVGNGGMFGQGVGQGAGAYGYLPEAANDSIFAIMAEKFGFIGVAIVIGLYTALFYRLKRVIERSNDPYARLFVTGVLAWLGIQTVINMSTMVGLLPLTGITLPFISYGGTSIVFVMASLGVVFQISRYTSFEPIRSSIGKGESNENSIDRGRVRRSHYTAASRRA